MLGQEIDDLIRKYLDGSATLEERKAVLDWYRFQNLNEAVWESENDEEDIVRTRILNKISDQIIPVRSFASTQVYRISFAAIVIFLLSASLYFLVLKPSQLQLQTKRELRKVNDVTPGSNKAILTLANGSKISLDDAMNGEIAQQSGIHIIKTAKGQLIYDISGQEKSRTAKVSFNTISTPRGGEYQINLPDGSKVWLNAESSLTYPTVFTGNERKVKLTGEAYFEIAHNRFLPFRVESSNQTVEVLGTHFNINSYMNEPVTRTTLLEGSVKVISAGTNRPELLIPGQESDINSAGAITLLQADTLQAVSWKNGDFLFNDMTLTDIMHQLERWYDVDVDYSDIPKTRYNGLISRSVNLSKVLKMLEVTGRIKFRIEGKAIKISKTT